MTPVRLQIAITGIFLSGCTATQPALRDSQRPSLAPKAPVDSGPSLSLDRSIVRPMYQELIPIDLDAVARVAIAQNPDIRIAREEVKAARGRLESAVGGALPAIVPTAMFEHFEGTARAVNGSLLSAGYNTFQPNVALQWIVNPGHVVYDIIAARKRLQAEEHREKTVVMATLRQAVLQYYDLALAQARLAAAREAEAEAEELLRILKLRVSTGTGVTADQLRGEAELAQRQQDRILALKAFFDASVALSLTLELDATVTLVPSAGELNARSLVAPETSIEDLLAIAVEYRPDLAGIRALAEAAAADQGATWWGGFGPQFQLGYQYGGITGHSEHTHAAQGIPNNLIVNPFSTNGSFSSSPLVNGAVKEIMSRGAQRLEGPSDQSFGFHDQQHGVAGVGWHISLSAFGDLKSATAAQRQAAIEAQRRLDEVCADVVTAHQAGRALQEVINLAQRQVDAAAEALRRTQTNLKAGTMTTLDVLTAQDSLAQARLRFADAVVRFNQAQVALLAAVGLLDADSLNP